MSDDAVRAAMAALAQTEIPGEGPTAKTLVQRATLRRRLERAARGSPVLEKGLPVVVAGTSLIALTLAARVLATDQSEALSGAALAAIAVFAANAALVVVQALSRS